MKLLDSVRESVPIGKGEDRLIKQQDERSLWEKIVHPWLLCEFNIFGYCFLKVLKNPTSVDVMSCLSKCSEYREGRKEVFS